jgi:hypothetical protein
MKRSRINPVSAKRKIENAQRKVLMLEKFGPRDGWKCSIPRYETPPGTPPCYGYVNGHEILKRSRGGSIIDMANVVLLCDLHNDWVEMNPTWAHDVGLAAHNWES